MKRESLRHFCHALSIQPDFANAFDACEDVINRLAADAHELPAHDAPDEIAREIEDFLRSRALKPFAKNRGHRTRECLHFRAERHTDVRPTVFIDVQVNTDRVSAFLILSYVNKIELLVFSRFLVLRVVRVRNERLAPLILRQGLEEVYDFVELVRIRSLGTTDGARLI